MIKNTIQIVFVFVFLHVAHLSGQDLKVKADSISDLYLEHSIDNYEESLPALQTALEIYKELKDSCKISSTAMRLGQNYDALGMLDSSLQLLLWSEPYAYACGNEEYAENAIALASLYINLEQFEKSIEYVEFIRSNWPVNAPIDLIEDLSLSQAIALVYLNRKEEAKTIFKAAYSLNINQSDTAGQIASLINLGAFFGMSQELDSAAYYLRIASGLCEKSDCHSDLDLLQNLATLAAEQEDYALSASYLDIALAKAKKANNIKAKTELLREISIATFNGGDTEQAWSYLIEHSNMLSSLFNTEMAEAIANHQEKYASEKKARQIQELEIQKLDAELRESDLKQIKNVLIIASLSALLLAIGLWSRLKYISKTKSIIEQERNRSNELLLNILPFEIAEELKEKGRAEAKNFETASILFTDFKEFTQAASQLSAENLVKEINACFEAFDHISTKYGIEKIKTIGDAYMAAGGLPIPTDFSVKNTVLAAIAMQSFIGKRKVELDSKGLPAFEMRVGIHTGPVVAGIVGLKKFQYDIWGDTVNTASRMESSGAVGKVNISQATYELLKDEADFTFESRGKIEIKGKGAVEMYFISVTTQ